MKIQYLPFEKINIMEKISNKLDKYNLPIYHGKVLILNIIKSDLDDLKSKHPTITNKRIVDLNKKTNNIINSLFYKSFFDKSEKGIFQYHNSETDDTIILINSYNKPLDIKEIRISISKTIDKISNRKYKEINFYLRDFNGSNKNDSLMTEFLVETIIYSLYNHSNLNGIIKHFIDWNNSDDSEYNIGYHLEKFKEINQHELGLNKISEFINIIYDTINTKADNAIKRGWIIANTINHAKNLINLPSNIADPNFIVNYSEYLCYNKLNLEIYDKDGINKLGMNLLLAVNQGSEVGAKFLVFRHIPKTKSKNNKKIALVGKGVTFDTGGISLKPSSNMSEMKSDMSGAAVVISVISILSQIDCNTEVIALVPLTDNMPDGNAIKPGDVVKSHSGKTVEISNTDAEGRLILADALSYATSLGATHIIDVATLTGACVVALGTIYTGVMSNNDQMCNDLIDTSKMCNENLWRLPLGEDYHKLISSKVADVNNIGSPGSGAGAITAGCFLEKFIDNKPWVHMDIAGTNFLKSSSGYYHPQATGSTISTLVRYIDSL